MKTVRASGTEVWFGVGEGLVSLLLLSVLELSVASSKTDPPDVLDRQKCLDALAELRRSKWFQVWLLTLSFAHSSVSSINRLVASEPAS